MLQNIVIGDEKEEKHLLLTDNQTLQVTKETHSELNNSNLTQTTLDLFKSQLSDATENTKLSVKVANESIQTEPSSQQKQGCVGRMSRIFCCICNDFKDDCGLAWLYYNSILRSAALEIVDEITDIIYLITLFKQNIIYFAIYLGSMALTHLLNLCFSLKIINNWQNRSFSNFFGLKEKIMSPCSKRILLWCFGILNGGLYNNILKYYYIKNNGNLVTKMYVNKSTFCLKNNQVMDKNAYEKENLAKRLGFVFMIETQAMYYKYFILSGFLETIPQMVVIGLQGKLFDSTINIIKFVVQMLVMVYQVYSIKSVCDDYSYVNQFS